MSVATDAPPSKTVTLGGHFDSGIVTGGSERIYFPFFESDPAPDGFLACQLADAGGPCPADYPAASAVYGIEDDRACTCETLVTHASPRLELFSTGDCSGAPRVVELADATCEAVARAEAVTAWLRVDTAWSASAAPTTTGSVRKVPRALCCPAAT